MSKFLSGIIIATALLSWTRIAHAQLPTALPTPPQSKPAPSIPAQPTPSIAPTSATPDLILLGKVISKFWQTNRAQTESKIVMSLLDGSTDLKVYATVKTIVQTGNKFRTELIFAQPGSSPTATYTIVCDGQNVWTYRLDKRQYAQTTFAKFQSESYSFLIGAASIFFLSIPEADRQEIITALAKDQDFLTSLPPEQIKELKGSQRQLDGQNSYVYSYEDKKEDWNFNGFIQPQTGILKQIELTGKTVGMKFTLVEKIVNRNSQPTVDRQSFRFSPPKGVKKVQSLPIDLLGG
jgi:outer membrane lipoprotein-sorting protein